MKTAGKSVLAKEKETQILSLKNPTNTKTNCLCGWMKGLHEPPPSSLLEINPVSSPTPEPPSATRRSATRGPEPWDGNPGLSRAVASLTSRMSWLFFSDPHVANCPGRSLGEAAPGSLGNSSVMGRGPRLLSWRVLKENKMGEENPGCRAGTRPLCLPPQLASSRRDSGFGLSASLPGSRLVPGFHGGAALLPAHCSLPELPHLLSCFLPPARTSSS